MNISWKMSRQCTVLKKLNKKSAARRSKRWLEGVPLPLFAKQQYDLLFFGQQQVSPAILIVDCSVGLVVLVYASELRVTVSVAWYKCMNISWKMSRQCTVLIQINKKSAARRSKCELLGVPLPLFVSPQCNLLYLWQQQLSLAQLIVD